MAQDEVQFWHDLAVAAETAVGEATVAAQNQNGYMLRFKKAIEAGLGAGSVDLGNYYTKAEIDALIAGGPVVTAPTITSANPSGSYPEGVAISGTVTTNKAATFSVTGPDASDITINANTGVWSAATTDYETETALDFTFVATGTTGLTGTQVVTIAITDVAEGGESGFPSTINTSLPNFGLQLANAPTAYPPQFNLLNLEGLMSGDVLWIVRSNDVGGTTGLVYYSHTLTDADLGMTQPISLTFAGLSSIASGDYYYAPALQRGTARSVIGTPVVHGSNTVAPTITSSATPAGQQFVAGSAPLTANQTVTWSVVGGADQANFSFTGAALNWTPFATSGAKAVTVRATNTFGITADQAITLTVAANTASTFTFTDASGVALSSTQTSNTITVAGITTAPVPVSITGGTYSKNGGAYTSAAGTAANGDTFTVRLTASSSYLTAADATLTIGTTSDTYTATTLADPAVPAGWAATTGQHKYSTITRTSATVATGVAAAGIRSIRAIPASASGNIVSFKITLSGITSQNPIYIGVDQGTVDLSLAGTNGNPGGDAKSAFINFFGDGGTTATWLIGNAYDLFQQPASNAPTGGAQDGDIVRVEVDKTASTVKFFHKRGAAAEVQVGTTYTLSAMPNWFIRVAASQEVTWTLDATLWGVP